MQNGCRAGEGHCAFSNKSAQGGREREQKDAHSRRVCSHSTFRLRRAGEKRSNQVQPSRPRKKFFNVRPPPPTKSRKRRGAP